MDEFEYSRRARFPCVRIRLIFRETSQQIIISLAQRLTIGMARGFFDALVPKILQNIEAR
jgi:hypothetical protein